ncbi:hypothetical protein [Aquicoccus sp.]|uniref:hypothetical protein n=1 Tax=Aquicoccus sp. TaxID=2055851 RepID=UPI003568C929
MPIDSPFDSLTGIRSPFGRGRGKPVIITATTAPSLGALTDGDTVQSGLAASATETTNYASTAGTISSAVETVTINGTTGALSDVVSFEDVVAVSILVTDSAGNTQTFNAGTQTVAAIITASSPPSIGAFTDGGTLSSFVIWGSYLSAEGTIVTPTTKEMSVNGAAFVAYDGNVTGSPGDTYELRETVSDSVGNTQSFSSGTTTVQDLDGVTIASTTTSAETIVFDPIAVSTQWAAERSGAGSITFYVMDFELEGGTTTTLEA